MLMVRDWEQEERSRRRRRRRRRRRDAWRVGARKARNYYLRGSWSMLRSLCSIGRSAFETDTVPRAQSSN
jgi:hypothetical protein